MHDKSRPTHQSKKAGKTLKQRRAQKRAAHEAQQPASIIPPRHAQR
jgi:hypothetical protein